MKALPPPEIGAKFGRYTVIDNQARTGKNNRLACVCKCDCGKIRIVATEDLRNGHSKSCGCLSYDKIKENGQAKGYSQTRIYTIWCRMKDRCYKTDHPHYSNYGGKGIEVCDEWKNDFLSFRAWALSNGYAENLSIDRIDNNKGYSPSNCRWATNEEQSNNTRRNRNITFNGKTQSVSMWAKEYNKSPYLVFERINSGWSFKDAITKPVREKRRKNEQKQIS